MTYARAVAGLALAIVAVYGLPDLQRVAVPIPVPSIIDPDAAMRVIVDDAHRILSKASVVDRALWSQVWSKVAIIANGDAADSSIVFTDTRSLRAFQIIALNIAWKRLAGNQAGKYAGLGEACEKAFDETLGKDAQAVTPEVRAKFVALANALAWCGINRG